MIINTNKCWSRLKSNPNKQCTHKKSKGLQYCLKHNTLIANGAVLSIWNTPDTNIHRRPPIHANIGRLQKMYRGYIVRKQIASRGIAVYCRHLCVNRVDCFDLESIERIQRSKFFSYTENGLCWGFHVNTLSNICTTTLKNPYNLEPISNKIVERFHALGIILNTHASVPPNTQSKALNLQQKCIKTFQLMDSLNNYTKCEWFLELTLPHLRELYTQMEDLWNYRLSLTKTDKKRYINSGPIFALTKTTIKEMNDYYNLAHIILNEFDRLLLEGKSVGDRTTASHWILSGFTIVHLDARAAFPWLYQSAIP